jgi:serine/threonine protein kinase
MRFPGLTQPPSYVKKKNYVLHQELGAGTFGKVIRATWTRPSTDDSTDDSSEQPVLARADTKLALSGANVRPGETREVALKVIPKKKVKGNESVVWSEMEVMTGQHASFSASHQLTICLLSRSCVGLITRTSLVTHLISPVFAPFY